MFPKEAFEEASDVNVLVELEALIIGMACTTWPPGCTSYS